MKFKKDGKVYGSIESVVGEHCQKKRYCFGCVLYRKRGTKCCEEYANENPEEVAHLLDFEVIDDTPNTAETVEENSEDVKRRLTRADILHAAEMCVCGQREQDYGTPENNFETIAELWETYLRRACVDEAGVLEFTPNCSIDLLKRQKRHMGEYLHDLEIRAEIEGVNLYD